MKHKFKVGDSVIGIKPPDDIPAKVVELLPPRGGLAVVKIEFTDAKGTMTTSIHENRLRHYDSYPAVESSCFRRQDIFRDKMVEDYKAGKISNPVYKPYLDWKSGIVPRPAITESEARNIINEASRELETYFDRYPDAFKQLDTQIDDDDVWRNFKEFGEDKYIVSYLYNIESELTTILLGGFLR